MSGFKNICCAFKDVKKKKEYHKVKLSAYLSVASGNVTRLCSQVMMGGGWALILHENLATEPSVTTMDVGWIEKDEIPAGKQTTRF